MKKEEEEYDFLIVGSGFGGSVSAMRLAQNALRSSPCVRPSFLSMMAAPTSGPTLFARRRRWSHRGAAPIPRGMRRETRGACRLARTCDACMSARSSLETHAGLDRSGSAGGAVELAAAGGDAKPLIAVHPGALHVGESTDVSGRTSASMRSADRIWPAGTCS